MPHVLILGQTESGKTTLAKHMARAYQARGIGVIVLDPMHDPDWAASFRTHDSSLFLEAVWKNKQCAIFVDESGDTVGRYDTVMQQLATKSRHWGHNVHFLCQRGAQLAMTIRDQCGHLYLFTTGQKDCKIHAEEWNQPELVKATQLPRGSYMHVDRYGLFESGKMF